MRLREFDLTLIVRLLAIAAVLVMLTGCGQKGPLYRPEPPALEETDDPAEDEEER